LDKALAALVGAAGYFSRSLFYKIYEEVLFGKTAWLTPAQHKELKRCHFERLW